MPIALACDRCGAELPPDAAHGPVQCAYCGATSVPEPRVVEKVVERVVMVGRGAGSAETDALRRALRASVESLACPRCDNALVEGRTGEHTLRGCETCGGIFLEPKTVAALEKTRDEMILHAAVRFMPIRMPFVAPRRSALTCPFCKVSLVRLDLGETGHSIDTCATHGTFFDRGEVPVFADLCQERRAGAVTNEDLENAGIPQGVSWWSK